MVQTWPRATYLVDGKLPATRDAGVYVWDFWWMARQVTHLGNPWFTRSIAAPGGGPLAYHALMPLEGVVMMPVTLVFGPSAAYNLLSIALPGLFCYAMYRAARLWLASPVAAIAAGAFFGLSSVLTWPAWYQLNLAAGALFLPLALEAAVRLRRRPSLRRALILGAVVGGSLLTDQEMAVLVAMLVAAALLPWLISRQARDAAAGARGGPSWRAKLSAVGAMAAAALAVASPQLAAMAAQSRTGGAPLPPALLARYYAAASSYLPGLFAVSPRAVRLGPNWLHTVSYHGHVSDGVPTMGLLVTVLAVLGLIAARRRLAAWLLALLWLSTLALAMGATLKVGTHNYVPLAEVWHGRRLSRLLPYTWFVRVPGLAGFREASRLTMLAILPAALLAGAAVDWLRSHAKPLVFAVLIAAIAVLGASDAGWAGNPRGRPMPNALPNLDRPIAADHSASIVVDIPFAIRGGVPLPGEGPPFNPDAQVLATADGHPRAIGYFSRIPARTLAATRRNAFYAGLYSAEGQPRAISESLTGTRSYAALLTAARTAVRRMDIGWVLVWQRNPNVSRYLARTGFRFDYRADGVSVYRPAWLITSAGNPGSPTTG